MENIKVYICSLVLIFLLFGCKEGTKLTSSNLLVVEEIEPIKEISIRTERLEIKLSLEKGTLFFSKDDFVALIDSYINMFKNEIKEGRNIDFNKNLLAKYSDIKNLLSNVLEYNIINPNDIDSLSKRTLYERNKIIENDVELGFKYYFNDLLCQLLDSGNVAVMVDSVFVPFIVKNNFSEKSAGAGYSRILYTTKEKVKLCECPPYFHFD